MTSIGVAVQILGKEYRISCRESEKQALLESARLLDEKMREIKDSGKIASTESIAILSALNIAHDLVQRHELEKETAQFVKTRLQGMREKIDVALDENMQLPV